MYILMKNNNIFSLFSLYILMYDLYKGYTILPEFSMALYVASIVSFCFPHVVDVSTLSICIDLRAFVVVLSFFLYVSFWSRVIPNIIGLMFMGSVMLLNL